MRELQGAFANYLVNDYPSQKKHILKTYYPCNRYGCEVD